MGHDQIIALHKHKTLFLISIFFLALAIRSAIFFGYLAHDERYWQTDSPTYEEVAFNLTAGKGYTTGERAVPYFFRLPGYPLFIAAIYKIFGQHRTAVVWVQLVLSSLIPLLIFSLSLVLFPNDLVLAASAAVYSAVLHLGFMLYASFFMTETLFVIFFLLFLVWFLPSLHLFFCKKRNLAALKEQMLNEGFDKMFCPEPACTGLSFVEFLEQRQILVAGRNKHYFSYRIFLAGCFLGVASLIRPVGHYLVCLSLILFLFSRCESFSIFVYRALSILSGWLLIVGPWLVRNFMLTGYIFFHTLPGMHFLYLSASRVAMHEKGCDFAQARLAVQEEYENHVAMLERNYGKLSDIERCHVAEKLAADYFVRNPLASIKVWLTDMMRTALSLYSAELVFLESGRKPVDYFARGRSLISLFKRYLVPQVDSFVLILVIYLEIILFFFLLFGFFGGIAQIVIYTVRKGFDFTARSVWCVWGKSLGFMVLFIVISLAGGYARMRLGLEPFLIIFSLHFWTRIFVSRKECVDA